MSFVNWSAQGTVRQGFAQLRVPSEIEGLEALRETLGDALFAAARELAACVPLTQPAPTASELEARATVLCLAGACLWSARSGSTRLPIGTPGQGPLRSMLEELSVDAAHARRVFALLALPPAERGPVGALLGSPGEYKPLLCDGTSVFIQRVAVLEVDLGQQLRARLLAEPTPLNAAQVRAALEDLCARAPQPRGQRVALSDEQRRAVLTATHQRLTVISGGPGTGKTSIVVSMLRLLVRLGTPIDAIALAAPTGKAAHRLDEAIDGYLRAIAAPAEADEALLRSRPAPTTLHRLLGYSPRGERFAHHARNPLPHEVIIVDEASMVDLSLMTRLLRAAPPLARLVLLGDAEQLPSVEAGAVLRDLMPGAGQLSDLPARPWDELVSEGDSSPAALGARARPEPSTVQDARSLGAVRLTKSYRMDERDPAGRSIALASQAVRAGRRPDLAASSEAGALAFAGAQWLAADEPQRAEFLERWFAERVAAMPHFEAVATRCFEVTEAGFGPKELEGVAELDRHLQQARLLCLTRSARAASGTGRLNAQLAALLAERLGPDAGPSQTFLRPGTPLLMTRNDYELELFNGDQGVALWVRRENEDEARVRFVFGGSGGYRAFEPAALGGQIEPCWAMTVHKAQGSEFDHVALFLPTEAERREGSDGSGLASRELLYTAMTRARRSVTLVGSEAALDEAIARGLQRWSALGAAEAWRPDGV